MDEIIAFDFVLVRSVVVSVAVVIEIKSLRIE